MYIEKINGPEDVKKLNIEEMTALAEEMRHALLKRASIHGGHFGPNFGMVEAIIALHYVFESPKDKMVFDVSHQTYPHKMLTGRKDAYLYEEHYDDVTGYSCPQESEHDHFTIGHTSTSVSLACGLAKARDLRGESANVIAIIGDGSLSGGEALEGMDFAAELDSNMIIVVNDNDMSIAENHGGLYSNLKLLRETNGQAECNLFKAMGLDYVYVDHGNDLRELIGAFKQVKDSKKPVVVHINTLKGKGYKPAEEHKEEWHWHLPFDIETGKSHFPEVEDYSSVTCEYLIEKMKKDPTVVAITSGTPTILGFTQEKRKQAGRQFVDVGIAEETAVALASGIAKGGGKPVYGVYSSFIQRTYDQISQDLCIDGNPATIVVYTGSVFGMTDVTHLGLQDIPMLSNIPGLVYLAPTTKEEYLSMLDWSVEQKEMPVAIKLPGGDMISDGREVTKDWSQLNTYEVTEKGSKIALIGLGTFYFLALQTAEMLEKKGIHATVINPYYITGLDEGLLEKLKADHDTVVTLEDGILNGGFGEKIARFYGSSDMKVYNYGLKKEFLDRYDVNEVLKENHLTAEQIVNDVL
ncbi:MAG: 1-deoxy-D-xylulose-5-phosphate synthase [Roseburia faecis]|uniref:1-deoxy-D-xylulose-5-phosphate synthase n=1 Tax=Roseburia faecis TaxID=301302 RepID=UPI002A8BB7B6|nr:1-deoxy-D-xylulose-5-phosphate synthase [Roseburia faecis]MDY6242779.1 1-deoxy-D-xylulose-5-phosphate synthase [Lachnospiraceae bacterium]MDY4476633.1 1-deoxy-D-xylulose-5-phosphate synthase [Roseburia faecis]MDY6278780.1 1-deoxy-D-xylulose-5-phosphate synthase [Roseburia faecis]MDY6353485.1 1-deoxy-D-xylulose-5-phosphate synthase [Lachnospiraceae bacterium]